MTSSLALEAPIRGSEPILRRASNPRPPVKRQSILWYVCSDGSSDSVMNFARQNVTYSNGLVSGTEWTDTVTIGKLVVPNQSIGVAARSAGFDGVDGMLG